LENLNIKEFTLTALANLDFSYSLGEHNIYTLSIPRIFQSNFSNRQQMKFTFLKEVADDYNEVEYAVEGSYLINVLIKLVIENSPIIVEYVKSNAGFTEPEFKGTGRVSLNLEKQLKFYRPLYEFRLRLECSSDQMLLEFFLITINHQGKIINKILDEQKTLPAIPVPEQGININNQLMQPDFIKDLYQKASQYVLEQVKNKITGFERECNIRLIVELDKLNGFRTQSNTNEQDKRIQMEGLRDKYSVKVNIEPAGLIIKFFPFLQSKYRLIKHGKLTDLVLDYHGRLYSNSANLYSCKSCGQRNQVIDICDEDHHIVCDMCAQYCQKCESTGCLQHPLAICHICNSKICRDCRTICSACNRFFCKEHQNQCLDCGVFLCPEHTFECASTGRLLCPTHSGECSSCCKHFHHTLVKQCEHPGCTGYLCSECQNKCAACGLLLCQKHTLVCETTREQRCHRHVFQCEACGRYHGIEYKNVCYDCGKNLCPSCVKNCVNGHLMCPDHAYTCTISSQTVCENCATKCHIHDHLVNKKLTAVCVVCTGVTCVEHSLQCIVCGNDVCVEHTGVCGDCLKNACTNHLGQCVLCGRIYCAGCIKERGLCGMCDGLIWGKNIDKSKLKLLLPKIPWFERFLAWDLRYSSNSSYQIISFRRIYSIHVDVFDAKAKLLLKKKLKRDFGI
jgi:hypothetical protein